MSSTPNVLINQLEGLLGRMPTRWSNTRCWLAKIYVPTSGHYTTRKKLYKGSTSNFGLVLTTFDITISIPPYVGTGMERKQEQLVPWFCSVF